MALIKTDRGGLAAPVSAKIFEGRVARTHSPEDPLVYGPDDHECRDQAELERIVAQLVGIPVTLLHPNGLIRDGVEARVVGTIVGGRIDVDTAVAQMLITDDEALAAIESGVHELSMGYSCTLDDTRYQRNIALDHVAVVPRGRCGKNCALRADCGCETAPKVHVESTCTCNNRAMNHNAGNVDDSTPNSGTAEDIVMDELKEQLAAALADAAAQKARADQADKDRDAQKARADQLETDAKVAADNAAKDLAAAQKLAETETARADQAVAAAQVASEKAHTDAAAEELKKFDAAVATRVKVLTDANTVLGTVDDKGAAVDRSATSNRDIKIAIVKHVDGDEIPTDAVDAYVDGMYEGALRRHAKAVGSRVDARTTIASLRQNGAVLPKLTGIAAEKAAQEAMTRRDSTAWMTNVTKEQE